MFVKETSQEEVVAFYLCSRVSQCDDVHFFLHLENVPKATLKKDPDLNPMYVGETVNFTCNVGMATGWQYQLRNDGRALNKTDKTFSMDLQLSAAGRYSCLASRGRMTTTEISGEIKQDVASKH